MQIKLSILIILVLFCSQAFAQNKVFIDGSKAEHVINRNIYGHFAEHLGRCIYGGIYVGRDNKKIPNRNGVRLDVVEALKKLKVPVLRWPGGCYADNYHWRDGIGPVAKRRQTQNVSWGDVREDNSFGTHEFLEMCEWLGTEPYLAINMGSGTVQEAAEWVQYVNHANGSSELTDMRQRNGRATPWKVKYWGVGNESWDCGGNMTVEYYVNQYKKYATFMTNYDNTKGLFRIAVGPGTEDYRWTEVLMRDIPLKMLEGVSIHHYSVIDWNKKSPAVAFSEEEYFRTMERALRMEKIVATNSAVMDKYDPQKKVALIVDEWGGWYETDATDGKALLYQQNTMRDAMIAGVTLNIFNNHCDRVRMANLAQCVNVLQSVILTSEEKMILTPTYHVMEMYNVHQDAVMLPVILSSGVYQMGTKKLQAVHASASRNKEGEMHISLVNIDAHQEQKLDIDLGNITINAVSGRILASEKLQDHNSFDNPERVKPDVFNNVSQKGSTLSVTLPPFSVVVLKVK